MKAHPRRPVRTPRSAQQIVTQIQSPNIVGPGSTNKNRDQMTELTKDVRIIPTGKSTMNGPNNAANIQGLLVCLADAIKKGSLTHRFINLKHVTNMVYSFELENGSALRLELGK